MKEFATDGLDYSGKCYICHSACYEDARAVADLIEAAFPKLNGKVLINSIGHQKVKQNLHQKKDYLELSLVKKLEKFVIHLSVLVMVKVVLLLMLRCSLVKTKMNSQQAFLSLFVYTLLKREK